MVRRLLVLLFVIAVAGLSGSAISLATPPGPTPTPQPAGAGGAQPARPGQLPPAGAASGPAQASPIAGGRSGAPVPADPLMVQPVVATAPRNGAVPASASVTAQPVSSPNFTKPTTTATRPATARAAQQAAPVIGSGAIWPGFDHYVTGPNDDNSYGPYNLGFSINYYGTVYTNVYINNNGNLTFGNTLPTYTPFGLTGATGIPILAPFFADVDTTTLNSYPLKFGQQVMDVGGGNIRNAFGATWYGVGHFGSSGDKVDYFQAVMIDRSDIAPNNWDLYYNYDGIQWETGSASGGFDGLGGQSAHVGFSNGSGQSGTYYEFIGSGTPGSFLDGNAYTSLVGHAIGGGRAGRYAFVVRTGDSGTRTPSRVVFNPASPDGQGNFEYLEKAHDGLIQGWIVDGQNFGVPNWQLDVSASGGSAPLQTSTDANGYFSFAYTAPGTTGVQTINATAHGTGATGRTQINVITPATFGVSEIRPAALNEDYFAPVISVYGTGFDANSQLRIALTINPHNNIAKDNPTNVNHFWNTSHIALSIESGMDPGLYDVTVSDNSGHSFTKRGGLLIKALTGPGDVCLPGLPPIHYNNHYADGSGGTIYQDISMGGFVEYTGAVDYAQDGSLHGSGGGLVAHTSQVGDLPILPNGNFDLPSNGLLAFLGGAPLNFAGFGLKLDNLQWVPNDPQNPCQSGYWSISGTLSIPGGGTVSVQNLNLRPDGITGQVSVDNLSIGGVLTVDHLALSFDTIAGNYDGAATIEIPWLGTISASATFRNNGLDDVTLSVAPSSPINLGPTGLQLTSVGGGAHHLQSDFKEFDIDATLAWPNFDLPGVNWGPLHINPPCHRLLGATNISLTLTLGGNNTPRVGVNAGVAVCDGQYQLANFSLNFGPQSASVTGNVSLGTFSGYMNLNINYWPFTFDGSIQGSYIGKCGFIWTWDCSISGGFGISNTRGFYWKGGSGGSAQPAGKPGTPASRLTAQPTTVTSAFLSLPIDDGSGVPSRMLIDSAGVGTAVPDWQYPAGVTAWTPATVTNGSPVLSVTIPAGLPTGTIGATWQNGSADINLVDPNGVVYTPQNLPGGAIYWHRSGANVAWYTFPNGVAAGTWTVQFPAGTDTTALGTVTPVVLAPATNPTLAVTSATVNANGTVSIAYDAAVSTGTGAVSLFYNTANSSTGGTAIANDRTVGSGQSFSWTPPATLPSGTYYIYGVVNDGTHAPVSALAAQPIQWTNALTPATPGGLTSTAHNGVLHASWTAVPSASITGYSLDLLDAGGTLLKSVAAPVSAQYDFTGLTPASYQLRVSSVIASGLSSAPSAPVTATLPAPSYPVLSNVQWSATGPTGQSTVIVTGSDSNTSSIVVTDNGALVFGPVTPAADFSIAVPLTPGANHLSLTATSPTGDTASATQTVTYAPAPPALALTGTPWTGTTTASGTLAVTGITDPGVTLRVNGAVTTVATGGAFTKNLTLAVGINSVTVLATNAVGVTASVSDTITYTPPKPVVSTLDVHGGAATGGIDVTVTGTNFCPGGSLTTTVTFGPNPGTNVRCIGTTQLVVTSPAGTGVVDVRVSVGAQTSDAVAADRFTYVNPDTTPPQTAVTTTPTAPNGAGWFNTAVQVALSASDNAGGSGVAATYYALDTAACAPAALASCSIYAGAVSVTADGRHSVRYFSLDRAGNSEAVQTLSVNVDTTPPVVQLTGPQAGATYTGVVPKPVCTASDALSGMATQPRASSLSTPVAGSPGKFKEVDTCAGAVDAAGNRAAPVTVTYYFTRKLSPF